MNGRAHINGLSIAFCNLLLCSFSLSMRAQEGAKTQNWLHFPWKNVSYSEYFFKNGHHLDSLAQIIQSYGLERIESIDVVSYTSPDASYAENWQFTQQRAQQFNQVFRKYFPDAAAKLNVVAGGEAWELLHKRLVADQKLRPRFKNQILDILEDNTIGSENRKERLKAELSAHNYQYISFAHFRMVRGFDVTVHLNGDMLIQGVPMTQLPHFPISTEEAFCSAAMKSQPEELAEKPVEIKQDTREVIEPMAPGHPIMALSTNLLYDFTYIPQYGITSIPSFSLEIFPSTRSRFTLGADVEWPMWTHPSTHRYMQINNVTLWTRFYFKRTGQNLRHRGWYALASVNGARYGIGLNANKGWEGEGLGASLGAGYKLTIGKYFFLDFGLAAGFFYSGYDPYVWGNDATNWYYYDYYGDPDAFQKRNHRLFWAGPTRVYISLGFDIWKRGRRTVRK